MLGGVGSRALGILEHKGGVITHLTHQREGELVVFLRLRMITHKDVGRETAVGDDTTNSGHAVKIPLTGILTVHEMKDTVAAALYR